MANLFEGAPKDWLMNEDMDQISPEAMAWLRDRSSRHVTPEYAKTMEAIKKFRENPVLSGQSDPTGAIAWDTRMAEAHPRVMPSDIQRQKDLELMAATHARPEIEDSSPYQAWDTRMAEENYGKPGLFDKTKNYFAGLFGAPPQGAIAEEPQQ